MCAVVAVVVCSVVVVFFCFVAIVCSVSVIVVLTFFVLVRNAVFAIYFAVFVLRSPMGVLIRRRPGPFAPLTAQLTESTTGTVAVGWPHF